MAGVSTATVSRVLSGIGKASPETSHRVRAAASELGYRPSAIARSLKLRATRTLGLIVTDIENPFFPQLVRGAEDAARDAGYALLLCNASDDPDREAGYLDLLVDRRVDGLIIAAGSLPRRHAGWLARSPLPVVLVNTRAAGLRLPSVVSANRAGGRLAVEHLLQLEHRRIGVLTAPPRHHDAPDRLAGGRDAIAAAGLSGNPLVVVIGDAHVGGGERAAAELLTLAPDVTAIVAYNDLMAIGAMRTIRSLGRSVPRDVSVVGFDDIDLAAYVEPALTTIAQQTAEMGRRAVETLTVSLRSRPPESNGRGLGRPSGSTRLDASSHSRRGREVVLDVHLVVRGSTAAARLAR
jgi:LacI family transcriptional regulator